MFKSSHSFLSTFVSFILCSIILPFEGKSYAQGLSGDSVVHISLQQAIELGLQTVTK